MTYRDYKITTYRQHRQDYPPWVAMALATFGNVIVGFNVEGASKDDVIQRAQERIDESTP